MRSMFVLACLLLFSVSSAAQEVDSAAYLPSMMTSGERVIVTGAVCLVTEPAGAFAPPCLAEAGTATIRGRVEHLTNDVLVIAGPTRRYTFPLAGIDRIERPRDSVWNGALIGYAAGVAVMTVIAVGDSRGPHESFASALGFGLAAGSFITGPIGLGIGALGDAVTSRPRLVFAATPTSAISRATGLARRAGISVSIGF
jgi:hypothetical protein